MKSSHIHYAELKGRDTISKTKMNMIHNLVNTAKAFFKEGKTSHGRTFHCCFGIDHGKVKEIGFNSYNREISYLPKFGNVKKFSDDSYKMGLHAEVNLILKLGKTDFSSMSFLNVRIDKNGHNCMSRPCLNCLSLMQIAGVKSCWYFDEEQNKFLEYKL